MLSPLGQSPFRKAKGKFPLGGQSIIPLFQAGKATKDNGPERVCPAEKEGGAGGAGLGQEAWKIPFDPPYLWRASLLIWPVRPFVTAFPGAPQSKHNQVYVLTALLYCVCSFQQRERAGGSTLKKSPSLIRMLTIKMHVTMH